MGCVSLYLEDTAAVKCDLTFGAIELAPSRSESYGDFVMFFLLPLGRLEEALHQMRVAEKADPLSPGVHYRLAYVLRSAGRHDEAASYLDKLPAGYGGRDLQTRKLCCVRGRATKPSGSSKQPSVVDSRLVLSFARVLAVPTRRPAAARSRETCRRYFAQSIHPGPDLRLFGRQGPHF